MVHWLQSAIFRALKKFSQVFHVPCINLKKSESYWIKSKFLYEHLMHLELDITQPNQYIIFLIRFSSHSRILFGWYFFADSMQVQRRFRIVFLITGFGINSFFSFSFCHCNPFAWLPTKSRFARKRVSVLLRYSIELLLLFLRFHQHSIFVSWRENLPGC